MPKLKELLFSKSRKMHVKLKLDFKIGRYGMAAQFRDLKILENFALHICSITIIVLEIFIAMVRLIETDLFWPL